MKNTILIRDIDQETLSWIKNNIPEGISQNEFLKNIISDAKKNEFTYSLFDKPIMPSYLFGKLPFKFIDLFAGIGGFRSGLTSIGGKCVFTSEWDKYANITYKAWYGNENIYNEDIRLINAKKEIPNHDVLCAGFPCQPFSIAGVSKKNSLGRDHGFKDANQGNLFFKIMEIVDAKKPPVLILENVKNLKSHDKGNTFKIIENEIKNRNYQMFHKIIDARQWVPQHRERIFIVCFNMDIFKTSELKNFDYPSSEKLNKITLKQILEKKPDNKYMLSDKLWNYLQNYAEKHRKKGNGFGYGLNNFNDVSRTMSARYYKDGSEILINQKGWENPRRLTPREAKLLMGFNQKYADLFGHDNGFPQVVSDTQSYKQFGNAVVPQVVEEIGLKVIEVMVKHILMNNKSTLFKT